VEAPFGLNPYENDPGAASASMINSAEILLECLERSRAKSVVEIGAFAGDLTRMLLLWAERPGARVIAIDPSPQPQLEELEREHEELELIRETSLAALPHVEVTDAVIIDGDHNYYTVSEELQRIEARWREQGAALPLLVFHDVGWPHARRDDYFDPQQVPPEYRQPVSPGGGLHPSVRGTVPGGLPYRWPAAEEGGPRNGVLTAIEDFLSGRDELRLVILPPFFGVGVLYRRDAAYAQALDDLLAPWDRHPLLERLERNRVLHLASSHIQLTRMVETQGQLARHQALFEAMLASRVFGAAERFLRVRQRGDPAFSKELIRRALAESRAPSDAWSLPGASTAENGGRPEPTPRPDASAR